jgi:hypothetical protein
MVEDADGREDTCPQCEGGLWRERVSWRGYSKRLRLPLGLRLGFRGRWPYIYRDWPA